ncbi:hypothetical protein B0H12DRAFT_330834 [Mycena haematopus]|nr:hypothetical protein B0H12DRAFT_330834 [Mycena haematopus]
MGPDLLFILELADGKRIWVAVQSKFESSNLLTAEKLKEALRTVTPKNYFSSQKRNRNLTLKRLSELPNRQTEDIGDYSVLRVVASFPGVTALTPGPFKKSRRRKTTLQSMEHWNDVHPLASLNILYLAKITKDMAPRNFLTSVPNAPKPKREDGRKRGRKKADKAPKLRVNENKPAESEDEEDEEDEEDDEEDAEDEEDEEGRPAKSVDRCPAESNRFRFWNRLHLTYLAWIHS